MWFAGMVSDGGSEAVLADFQARIVSLYEAAGRPSLRELARHADLQGRTLPISTVHDLLKGGRIPRWVTVEAYVGACLADAGARKPSPSITDELQDFGRWRHLYQQVRKTADQGHQRGVTSDRAPVSPPGKPKIPAQLPTDVPAFTGRLEQLAELDQLLDPTSEGATASDSERPAPRVAVISGMGGVGKSALAIHWAHRAFAEFPDGQLYVNMHGFDRHGSVKNAAEAIRGFLEALGVSAEKIPADLDAQAALYRSLLSVRRTLVVLDNASDAEQVRSLLPDSAAPAAVIITSRNQLAGAIGLDGDHSITLELPTTQEARELMIRRLGLDRLAGEPEAAEQIIAHCGRLPLALAIVVAQALTRPTLTLTALSSQLRQAPGRLNALTGGDLATDIRAVFSWSYQILKPEAAQLFRLLSLHPGPEISVSAAANLAAIPLGLAQSMLGDLAQASLIIEREPERYVLHDLVRDFAAELVEAYDSVTQRHGSVRQLLEYYLHTSRAAERLLVPHRDDIVVGDPGPATIIGEIADEEQATSWFAAEHGALLATVDLAATVGLDSYAWQMVWTLAPFLDRRGHWRDLIQAGSAALTGARRSADPLAQIRIHRLLGFALMRLGNQDEAAAQLHQALELSEQADDLKEQAHAHGYLSMVLEQKEMLTEAFQHDIRALELYQAAGDRHGAAQALNAVGWGYARLNDFHRAIDHCQRALSLHQSLRNLDGEAATWDSLGYAYHHLGNHAQAVRSYEHALALIETVRDRYWEADTLNHLGDTYAAAGDREAAREAWQQALEILRIVDHPDAAVVAAKLADSADPRESR